MDIVCRDEKRSTKTFTRRESTYTKNSWNKTHYNEFLQNLRKINNRKFWILKICSTFMVKFLFEDFIIELLKNHMVPLLSMCLHHNHFSSFDSPNHVLNLKNLFPPTKFSIPLNSRSNALTLAPIFNLATISKQKYKYGNLTLIMDALSGTELEPFTTNWRQ